jgi:hypothetical protein
MSSRSLAKFIRCALYRDFVNLTLASGVAGRVSKNSRPWKLSARSRGFSAGQVGRTVSGERQGIALPYNNRPGC